MFGHSGISALEFAGIHQEVTRKTLSLKGKSTPSTHNENKPRAVSADAAELELPQPVLQESSSQQRHRGTFINHTPRNFEMCSSKRTEFPPTSNDNYSQPHTSFSQQGKDLSLGSWPAKGSLEVNTYAPVEFDSQEAVPNPVDTDRSKSSTSYRGSITSSLASKVTRPSTPNLSNTHNSRAGYSTSPIAHRGDGKKRRRRQTPYKISVPKSANAVRYSPLEPWVAYHRRKRMTSTFDDLSPQVDIDDIAEMSAFRAIQEYFDSQISTQLPEPSSWHWSSSSPKVLLPNSPELPPPSSPIEATATFPTEELDFSRESTPSIPSRNPKRLHPSLRLPIHSTSRPSLNGDFTSAAQGQYSPYDEKNEVMLFQKRCNRPAPPHIEPAAKAGSSNIGRMAPPILGHEALTAIADLNDLNFYLRNTGPSLETMKRPRMKPAFKMFKFRGKKTRAARVGSLEGSPSKARPTPPVPACAREMTTSGGAKHLQILIPDETITLPVAGPGLNRCLSHVSITWTEEILNPLASLELEHAISGLNTPDLPSPVPPAMPLRGHRRSRVASTTVPVDDHPLATREEQTRTRKLRDLEKVKRQTAVKMSEDTTTGALTTPVQSPVPMCESPMKSVEGEEEEESSRRKIARLQQRVISLRHQNTKLAEALMKFMGLEPEDGDLDADEVLRAYRQLRISGYESR